LGFLSVGHMEPNHFTQKHLRRAELLAIPAAVAIQNARLYSTAEIYGSELEKRLSDLQQAEQALINRRRAAVFSGTINWFRPQRSFAARV
jgi:GAF domain-containing protein